MNSMKTKLTAKQERFVQEYVIDFNATQAAIRAGYAKNRADQTGYENLKKPEIQKRIQALKEKTANKLEITAERVLLERARIAFANISGLFDKDGNVKSIDKISKDLTPAIAHINIIESPEGTRILKFRLENKNSSLNALGKYLGLYERNNVQKGVVTKEARQAVISELLAGIAAKQSMLPEPVH